MEDKQTKTHLLLDGNAASSVDAFLEYKRIVGDDDGGTLFTPEQYEAYKNKMLPIRMKNRLYVSWTSATTGIECKMVGPETKCFCQHRYRQHNSDFVVIPEARPIAVPCGVRGCACKSFLFIPMNGSRPLRCKCKHSSEEHSVSKPHKCCTPSCGCLCFSSSYTCGCGDQVDQHVMNVETKDERMARGRPVGRDVLYKGMGCLTGFSSLVDGYMRLDSSGIGAVSKGVITEASGGLDHPFVRMHTSLDQLRLGAGEGRMSAGAISARSKEESDMAFFERRYQQRLRAAHQQAHKPDA